MTTLDLAFKARQMVLSNRPARLYRSIIRYVQYTTERLSRIHSRSLESLKFHLFKIPFDTRQLTLTVQPYIV